MPKVKSHSGARKRLRKLKSGKVKYSKSFHRHLLTKKSAKRKRGLKQKGYVSGTQIISILKLLPY